MTEETRKLATVASFNAGPHSWEVVYKAWTMRKTTDMTVREIAGSVGCSPTSVLNWVRDIDAKLARINVAVDNLIKG